MSSEFTSRALSPVFERQDARVRRRLDTVLPSHSISIYEGRRVPARNPAGTRCSSRNSAYESQKESTSHESAVIQGLMRVLDPRDRQVLVSATFRLVRLPCGHLRWLFHLPKAVRLHQHHCRRCNQWFFLAIPLRYLYRKLWSRSPAMILAMTFPKAACRTFR